MLEESGFTCIYKNQVSADVHDAVALTTITSTDTSSPRYSVLPSHKYAEAHELPLGMILENRKGKKGAEQGEEQHIRVCERSVPTY